MVMNVSDALAAYRNGGGISGKSVGVSEAAGGESFSDALKEFATDAISGVKGGEKAIIDNMSGKTDLTSVVTAISNAEMMLQTVVTIRDKVIGAYQEITRTQI